jgi:hypothetical protein
VQERSRNACGRAAAGGQSACAARTRVVDGPQRGRFRRGWIRGPARRRACLHRLDCGRLRRGVCSPLRRRASLRLCLRLRVHVGTRDRLLASPCMSRSRGACSRRVDDSPPRNGEGCAGLRPLAFAEGPQRRVRKRLDLVDELDLVAIAKAGDEAIGLSWAGRSPSAASAGRCRGLSAGGTTSPLTRRPGLDAHTDVPLRTRPK